VDSMKYKGYQGTAEVNAERGVCWGKVLFLTDVVTYEAVSASDLRREFEEAVDDYLETCKELGREPCRPFSGVLQVRLRPELHRELAKCAAERGATINAIVAGAVDAYVGTRQSL